jgi:hypothetical protein
MKRRSSRRQPKPVSYVHDEGEFEDSSDSDMEGSATRKGGKAKASKPPPQDSSEDDGEGSDGKWGKARNGTTAKKARTKSTAKKAAARPSSSSPPSSSSSSSSSAPPPAEPAYKWLVMKSDEPSSYGCNQGMSAASRAAMASEEEVGSFDSKAEAVEAAVRARDHECSFEGWSEAFYGAGAEPPFFSGDGENYDDDRCVFVSVMRAVVVVEPQHTCPLTTLRFPPRAPPDSVITIFLRSPESQAAAAKTKVAAEKPNDAGGRGEAGAPKPNDATGSATAASGGDASSSSSGSNVLSMNAQLVAAKQWVVSFGEMKDGTSAAEPPPVDTGVFWRCPCLIDGAKIGGIGSYPVGPRGGMLGNILRTSDRNYLMRSFCTDGASTSGAKFASFKQTNVYQRTAAWQVCYSHISVYIQSIFSVKVSRSH